MPLIIAAFISLMGRMELQALRYREQQKREAQSAPQPQPLNDDAPYTPAPAAPAATGFNGFTWIASLASGKMADGGASPHTGAGRNNRQTRQTCARSGVALRVFAVSAFRNRDVLPMNKER